MQTFDSVRDSIVLFGLNVMHDHQHARLNKEGASSFIRVERGKTENYFEFIDPTELNRVMFESDEAPENSELFMTRAYSPSLTESTRNQKLLRPL